MTQPLPKPPSLPLKERTSVLFVERGQLDVIDGACVLLDKHGVRTQLPIGGVACLMLEPGTRVSHAAVALAARVGCLLVWVGEAAVRVYSAGQPQSHRSDRLLHQASVALDPKKRLRVVRRMYEVRFGEPVAENRSIEQLRGIEGARVKTLYKTLAQAHGLQWQGRSYDAQEWGSGDVMNRCLSSATACLYGVTEAALLAAGYSPAIGFIHTGKPKSFVYDVADLFKFDTVIPAAFRVAARASPDPERQTRIACRDAFRRTRLLERIIPAVNDLIVHGGEMPKELPPGAIPPAIITEDPFADDDDPG